MNTFEQDYKYVSPPAVIVVAIGCLIGGYFYGWYVNQHHNLLSFVIAIILFYSLKYPAKVWQYWEARVTDRIQRLQLSAREVKVEENQWKEDIEEKLRVRLEKEYKLKDKKRCKELEVIYHREKPKGLFSHEDFDPESQSLLMNVIVKAHKCKCRVSKEDLMLAIVKDHYNVVSKGR